MDDVDEQLRVGLVGAGPWARRVHAPGLADHPGTRLAAVWARRRGAAEELAGGYGAEVCDSPDELLSTVDAVAFAVPPSVQAEIAPLAARAGRHLILEKPVGSTVDEALRVADAVSATGVASLVMLTRRFAPETRSWLAELDRLGGWAGGNARWLSGALLSETFANSEWRHSAGALADIGPHAVDLIDAALGEVTDVLAAHRSRGDLWQLMLGHTNGATSTLTMSLHLPVRPTIVDFSVYGQHGDRTLSGRATPAEECYTNLLDDFVAMVHSGTVEHPCDVRRGVHLQRVLDAARRLAG
ncbi:putative dehydrogenase [Streptoalloteichus tenebrarius]|uniref:Dehydrogenase n=1 Tax=Streptoalloteichus tenebrarius (strain ATCC 17920 / DSM 40477 / JCM 4838 / CBS 697.72 / NBRC 16177 / NCIMB 11028 / NRRL B-12390 / A12253. 1 / ISP 5477) TaxID=1933 RepID=A0ABT1HR66_STRSD|nr:Gfo/Idh/MocA family oxidoreductase [Streptoalloteichus tenebrarius]MCP2258016.1 putative dehydrogenase [Streptoalloteichus tenebrarius]BFF01684.1 Gfo/Idh/MocA family oxidoreductase [Streptoalloteichus tenebrarius]